MSLQLFITVVLVVTTLARPEIPTPYNSDYSAPELPVKYDFSYGVKDYYSGTPHGHEETRDGDFTEGIYYVQLPNGRLQQIRYTVSGDTGFLAELKQD